MTSDTLDQLDQNDLKPTGQARYIIPSAVSGIRVLIALLLVNQISGWPGGMLVAALLGVPVVFILDAIDGILARYLKSQTLLGSFIDIAADRVVEFIFLRYFVGAGLVPLWFVLVFYGRIVLTDACRMRAFGMEKVSAAGIVLPRPWNFLVLSKLSRSAYAVLKGVFFSVLLLAMYRGDMSRSMPQLGIMLSVLAFSILRAAPILITYLPRGIHLVGAKLQTDTRTEGRDLARLSTKFASWIQLASDVFLAALLAKLALH